MKSNTNKKSAPVSSAIRMPTSSSASLSALLFLFYFVYADWTHIVQTFSFHYLPMAGKKPKKERKYFKTARHSTVTMKIHSIRTHTCTLKKPNKVRFAYVTKCFSHSQNLHFQRNCITLYVLCSQFLCSLLPSSFCFVAHLLCFLPISLPHNKYIQFQWKIHF